MSNGCQLNSPEDIRRVAQKVINKILKLDDAGVVSHAAQAATLCNTWLKGWEIEKLVTIEARLKALEEKNCLQQH
jgi:hypothetical protein